MSVISCLLTYLLTLSATQNRTQINEIELRGKKLISVKTVLGILRHFSAQLLYVYACLCLPICLQGFHASWNVLDFFLENSRTWKVLENYFGPGKSWKLKLRVLESPEKISVKVMHFSSGLNGKQAAIVSPS